MFRRILVLSTLLFVWLGLYLTQTQRSLTMQRHLLDSQWEQMERDYRRYLLVWEDLLPLLEGHLSAQQIQPLRQSLRVYQQSQSRAGALAAVLELERNVEELYIQLRAAPAHRNSAATAERLTRLRAIEGDLGVDRRRYTEQVRAYNLRLTSFAASLMAGFLGLQAEANFPEENPLYLTQPYTRIDAWAKASHEEGDTAFGLDGAAFCPSN
jgi:LemA protein